MYARHSSNPVSLSYVAALRGVTPRQPGESFSYADLTCAEPDLLACLAASNPEGRFFGLVADENARAGAAANAELRGVTNVSFLAGSPQTLLAQIVAGSAALPTLDYLVCDESAHDLTAADRKAAFAVAEKLLNPCGLLNYSYRAYGSDDGALRFLVRELAPEMDAQQAKEFLTEVKKLGGAFLGKHKDIALKLDAAIAKQKPDEFFEHFASGEAHSGSFDAVVALHPRGFTFAGSADIASNYIELSVPAETQKVIADCAKSALYEQVKDYALDRTLRSDVWVRQPVTQTGNLATLFGGFTYGITRSREQVPTSVDAHGKHIDLNTPVFSKLIDLLALMPAGIGDFLSHPNGAGFAATEVVGAMQILVACGIAQPMRAVCMTNDITNVVQPRLVGGFNRYLDKMPINGGELYLSSAVLGGAVAISARDALVMQALERAGLANSVSALLPELERLAKNPAVAARVMDVAEPTAEIARDMIQDVVSRSIVQWYAYGLLEAA